MKERRALSNLEPYVPGRKRPGAVKLASNENPLGPSPRALEAVRAVASEIHTYPDKNAAALREALGRRHSVAPERIIVGNGSDEVLVMLAATYFNPGDNIITAEHTFSQYAFSAALFEAEIRRGAMSEGRFLLDEWSALMDSRTRAVFVCNPNNPTGRYATHDELVALLEAVPGDVLVVVDEAYQDYVTADDFPRTTELLERYPNLMVLHTFSKIFGMAGLRVGYGIASEDIISSVLKVKQPFNVGLPAQVAAIAALEDHEFVARSRRTNAAGTELLFGELTRRGFTVYPTQANFLCIHVQEDALDVAERIADGGVTVRPLNSFGMDGWIRVTIGREEDNRLFLQALAAACEARWKHDTPPS